MLTDDERRRGAQLLFDAERQRRRFPSSAKRSLASKSWTPIAFRIFGLN